MVERWVTFDCYGTLIDWNGGVRRELVRVFGEERGDAQLARYHEIEREIQRDTPTLTYREVLTEAMRRLGASEHEEDALARSLPDWPPFPETRDALEAARSRGWRLAVLSNTDRDYLEASLGLIGVEFDDAIVASEIGSYKPAHGHWRAFEEKHGRLPDVHTAASLYHDIAPTRELGIPNVWINRLGEAPDPEPDRELPDLRGLANALEEVAHA